MDYKQVIVVNKELNMSKGKMAAQVSHASMAFLTRMIRNNSKKVCENKYPVWDTTDLRRTKDMPEDKKMLMMYRRGDLYQFAKEASERGEDYFYVRPVNPDSPYGLLELCDPIINYHTDLKIDVDLYEKWIEGSFTKVILEAKNESQMQRIVDKAIENGFTENTDFFCIRDNCLTELVPDETGTRWTCIGFRPMDSEDIDKITKKLQLFKE